MRTFSSLLLFVLFFGFGLPFQSLASPPQKQETITFNLHLRLRNEAELRALIVEQQTPGSPRFRQWLSSKEFQERFAPSVTARQQVEAWIRSSGFEVVRRLNHGRWLTCQAPIDVVERTFHFKLAKKQTEGRTVWRATTPAQVPAEVSAEIQAIEGLEGLEIGLRGGTLSLSPETQNPPSKTQNTVGRSTRPATTFQPNAACDLDQMLSPSDLMTVYNLANLYNTGTTGDGQKIALLIPGAFAPSDLAKFSQTFGLPVATVEPLAVVGGTPGNSFPNAMAEVEYLAAFAPGVRIQVVQIPANPNGEVSSTDFMTAMAYVVDKLRDTHVVAMSFGRCESSLPRSTIDAQESLLMQAAAQGQTWVVAAGNSGADACGNGSSSVLYPASSVYVTSVGGTELLPLRDAGKKVIGYGLESAWNNNDGASGGGSSAVFDKPGYQNRIGVLPNGKRTVPDVSLHAAGNMVGIFGGIKTCYAGTGVPTVAWAAVFSMINQSLGGDGIGAVNTPLYALGGAQATQNGVSVFNDVKNGNNFVGNVTGNVTGPGYDAVTGWGSFDAERLVRNFTSGIPRPGLQLSTTALDFGTIRTGRKTGILKVTLLSSGSAALQVKEVKLDADAQAAGFTLEPCQGSTKCAPPFSLENREQTDFLLTLTPRKIGPVTGQLLISTNASNQPQVGIVLTGKGSDDGIPPKVTLLGFLGGETFEPKGEVPIRWVSSDDRGVVKQTLSLSINGGASYDLLIATGLAGNVTQFTWTVPDNVATSQGKIRIQAFDEAQNAGEDFSVGTFSIPDRVPPIVSLESKLPDTFEVGDSVTITWAAADNSSVVSQDLNLLVNGSTTPIALSLDGAARSYVWNTANILPGRSYQVALTVRDAAGNKASASSTTFTAQPKVSSLALESKGATISGFGFRPDMTSVVVNGFPLNRNSITIESNTSIKLKGKPKKLRLTPGSNLVVSVNGVDSKDFIVP